MYFSLGVFCEYIHTREGAHLVRLFIELVCTIRKQKQKKITFIVKKPNVFEIQCLKILKSKLSSVSESRYFR